jgi:hypothetical protein
MAISRIIANQLHGAVARLLQGDDDIPLSDCFLQVPPANIDCDLTSTCALKAAAILKVKPSILAEDICRLISADSRDSIAELARCLCTPEGYLNFQLKPETLGRWIAAVLSRESGWAQPPKTATREARITDRQVQLCIRRCRSILSAASNMRFDVENRLELTPLISEKSEDLVGSSVDNLQPALTDTLMTADSNGVLGTNTRRLLVVAGLLADDLAFLHALADHDDAHLVTPLIPSHVLSHAHDLAVAMLQFFDTEAIVSSHIDITRLRLAIIAVTNRMLTRAADLALS